MPGRNLGLSQGQLRSWDIPGVVRPGSQSEIVTEKLVLAFALENGHSRLKIPLPEGDLETPVHGSSDRKHPFCKLGTGWTAASRLRKLFRPHRTTRVNLGQLRAESSGKKSSK